MKRYMVLALCLLTLCLLTLTACGSKAAQDAEETPGDPTGSVRVVPAQGEALPTEGDTLQSGQQTAANSGGQQAPTEEPVAQQEPTQQPQQSSQSPSQNGMEKPEEDIWYEGISYIPSGQEMVRRASTYKPEKAAQAANDYLASKGAALNGAIDRENCAGKKVSVPFNEAFLSGGTAYMTTKLIAAAEQTLAEVDDINRYEFYCFGEKYEEAGYCRYDLAVCFWEKDQ